MFKVTLALLFGETLQALVVHFPQSVLGVMLAFSGLELALAAKPHTFTQRRDIMLMLITAGSGLALGTGFAFCLALLTDAALHFSGNHGCDRGC